MLEPHSPEQNTLFAALPASEYGRLQPHLERVPVELDRPGLMACVFECHAVVRRESGRLLSDTTAEAGGVS